MHKEAVSMQIAMIVLRLIHIGTAVYWGGTVFFLVSFLTPAVRAAGPEGGKVMQRLVLSRFPRTLPIVASLTVLSGLVMYFLDSGGLQPKWMTMPAGLGFTFGGIMGLTSLIIGLSITSPALNRMATFTREAMASGKPPGPERMKEIQALQIKMNSAAVWNAIFLALAIVGMATARYL
jgi:uncharacterized membrane protein